MRHHSLAGGEWHTYQIHNKHMSIDLHELLIVLTIKQGHLS